MKNLIFFLFAFILFASSCTTTTEIDPVTNREVVIVDQDITESTIWLGTNTYKVTRSIDVTNRALLTIQPGCIIEFVNDAELSIAYNDYGTVIARGTETQPILFTSEAPTKLAGDWYGFYFYEGSEGSIFEYCTIEYAGGYSPTQAAVNLRGGRISFTHCTVRESASFGYEVRNDAYFTGFAYNTVTRTKYDPMKITANSVYSLGDFNTFDAGTRIEINSGYLDEPGFHYWEDQPIPYYFSTNLWVGSESASGTELIIAPGTILQFAPGIELGVGYSNSLGRLTAVGEPNSPIIFTSSSSMPNNGDWNGIWLYTSTMPNTQIDNCIVSYGGGYSYGGNIILRNDVGNNVTVSNTTLSYSGQYGIYKQTGDPAPTLLDITYINNSLGDTNW